MKILRTPDECFSDLAEFPYVPNYLEVDDSEGGKLRVHYLDEGPRSGEVILCLHGQPTWSYLYRKMIAPLVAGGYRVIVPDMVGFGRSDKPGSRSDYSYERHVFWMESFIRLLGVSQLTLVCQDWGGLIGLRVLTRNPDSFARVVAANTALPDAKGMDPAMAGPMREMFASVPALPPAEMLAMMQKNEMGAGFMYWIKYCAEYENFVISDIINMSTGGGLSDTQKRAYDAPFPSEEYKQGARQFPSLVPIFPDDPAIPANREAWDVLSKFNKPFLTSFTDNDPVTAGQHVRFQEGVPGAQGQQHVTIKGGGHFLQEKTGAEFAEAILKFCADNPLADIVG